MNNFNEPIVNDYEYIKNLIHGSDVSLSDYNCSVLIKLPYPVCGMCGIKIKCKGDNIINGFDVVLIDIYGEKHDVYSLPKQAKQSRQIFLSIATIIMNDKIRLSIN